MVSYPYFFICRAKIVNLPKINNSKPVIFSRRHNFNITSYEPPSPHPFRNRAARTKQLPVSRLEPCGSGRAVLPRPLYRRTFFGYGETWHHIHLHDAQRQDSDAHRHLSRRNPQLHHWQRGAHQPYRQLHSRLPYRRQCAHREHRMHRHVGCLGVRQRRRGVGAQRNRRTRGAHLRLPVGPRGIPHSHVPPQQGPCVASARSGQRLCGNTALGYRNHRVRCHHT